MLCKRPLNFDQWKTFSKNYKPMRVWLWFAYKFNENYCHLWLFSEFKNSKEVTRLSWQNTYSNLKTTFYIKLKFLLWTKLLENLLLAKYLIFVTATLIFDSVRIIFIFYKVSPFWFFLEKKQEGRTRKLGLN